MKQYYLRNVKYLKRLTIYEYWATKLIETLSIECACACVCAYIYAWSSFVRCTSLMCIWFLEIDIGFVFAWWTISLYISNVVHIVLLFKVYAHHCRHCLTLLLSILPFFHLDDWTVFHIWHHLHILHIDCLFFFSLLLLDIWMERKQSGCASGFSLFWLKLYTFGEIQMEHNMHLESMCLVLLLLFMALLLWLF